MSIFKYLTLSHLQKVLAALETRFKGIEDNVSDIENNISNIENEVDTIQNSFPQSNWNETDINDKAYILNKPSMKAGTGENSVLIGQIEQDEDVQVFDIAISTSGSTTSVSYTSDSTIMLPSTSWHYYVLSYEASGVTYYREIESIDTENHIINTSSNVAGTHDNLSAKLYYKYKISGGKNSYAEGVGTISGSNGSHVEGWYCKAIGSMSHAEGSRTSAISSGSHSEGNLTISKGTSSHSEGTKTVASGFSSHAEGQNTTAQRRSQHVFGEYNILDTTGSSENVKGSYVEIVGNGTSDSARSNARTLDWNGNEVLAGKLTVGVAPTADMDVATKKYVDDNIGNIDLSNYLAKDNTTSYTPTADYHPATKKYVDDTVSTSSSQSDWNESDSTNNAFILNKPSLKAGTGTGSIVLGKNDVTFAKTYTIYITGVARSTTFTYTTEDTLSASESYVSPYAVAYCEDGYVQNYKTQGIKSIDISNNTITFYKYVSTSALSNSKVTIYYRHKDALGDYSVTEGYETNAANQYSHAEGRSTAAVGDGSHAEGRVALAAGVASHAEGWSTVASGQSSHAEGSSTIAASKDQHVQGRNNIEDENNVYAHIVGNGTSSVRSNAYTLDWDGNGWYAGKLTVGTAPTNDMDVATKKYVDDNSSSGSSTLVDLTDTSISSPTDGQLLKYNATTSKWENVTLSLAINNNIIQLKEGNTVISSVTLPVYNGGVSS